MSRTPPVLSYTYLFAPKNSDEEFFAEQIHDEFEKLSFGTRSRLIFLHDSRKNFSWYMQLRFWLAEHVFADEIDLDELFARVDCYIAGDNPDELKYLEKAYKLGIKIESFQAENINVFKNFPTDPNAENLKSNLKTMIERDLFSKLPLEKFEYILCENGYGETLDLFYLLKEYQQTTQKKIVVVCVSASRYEMMNLCPYVAATIRVNATVFSYLSRFYKFKNLWKLHRIKPRDLKLTHNNPFNIDGTKQLSLVRRMLNLPMYNKFDRYEVSIPKANLDNARKIFSELNLQPERTVFIATQANTFGNWHAHPDFKIGLVEKLRVAGFDVVANNPDQLLKDVPGLNLNFWNNVAFVSLCRKIIAVPAGWIEAMCSMQTVPINVHLVFPPITNQKISTDFLKNLQTHGKNVSMFKKEHYRDFFRTFVGSNVKFDVHMLDDDNLIDNIVDDLRK